VYVAYVKANPDVENIDQFFVFIYATRNAGLMKEIKEAK